MKKNGLDVFTSDHKRILVLINELWLQVKQSSDPGPDGFDNDYVLIETFDELRETLIGHITTEERMLFPGLEGFTEMNLMVDECYREHQRIGTVLKKIEASLKAKLRDSWADLLLELEEKVQIELVREEDWLFPNAKVRLGDVSLEKMFLQMAPIRSN